MSDDNFKKCSRCEYPVNFGIVLHNMPENCKERITFTYMKVGESMHAQCYIEHMVETIMKDKVYE